MGSELLLALRDRWHRVVTGVSVSRRMDDQLQIQSASCTTPVLMRPYSEEDIAAYIATGDPLDKAGSYGIQHPDFQPTERINGCYLNVVGLPLCVVVNLLARFDVHPTTEGRQAPSCPWSERCKLISRVPPTRRKRGWLNQELLELSKEPKSDSTRFVHLLNRACLQ